MSVSRENTEGWLTTEEVAEMYGTTAASVLQNFPRRYGAKPVNGLWGPGAIQLINLKRKLRRPGRPRRRAA